jgi:hypothetical protein
MMYFATTAYHARFEQYRSRTSSDVCAQQCPNSRGGCHGCCEQVTACLHLLQIVIRLQISSLMHFMVNGEHQHLYKRINFTTGQPAELC